MQNSPANKARRKPTKTNRTVKIVAAFACLCMSLSLASATCSAQSSDSPARYVDREGQPVTNQRLRQSWNRKPRTRDDLLLRVSRRVPVHLVVAIDERKISELLKSCAESTPSLEIRELRITHPAKRNFQYETSVEIFGVFHIFNPVDDELLRMKSIETAAATTDSERG